MAKICGSRDKVSMAMVDGSQYLAESTSSSVVAADYMQTTDLSTGSKLEVGNQACDTCIGVLSVLTI